MNVEYYVEPESYRSPKERLTREIERLEQKIDYVNKFIRDAQDAILAATNDIDKITIQRRETLLAIAKL